MSPTPFALPDQIHLHGSKRTQVILHIDDSDIDHEVLERSFKRLKIATTLQWCKNVRESHAFLHRYPYASSMSPPEPLPSIILLDLNLPGEDGRVFLKQLRATPRLSTIPVLILSSSSDPKDVEFCYSWGANAYLLKPLSPADMDSLLLSLVHFWLKHTVLPVSAIDAEPPRGNFKR